MPPAAMPPTATKPEGLDLPPITTVENDALTEDDMTQFAASIVDNNGLVSHNTTAFNSLLNEGIPHILTKSFDASNMIKDEREDTEADRSRESVKIAFKFTNPKISRPYYSTYEIGKQMPLYPNHSRISQRTYAASLSMGAQVEMTAYYAGGRQEKKQVEVPPLIVADIPIMVGCDHCHTWNLTREARKNLEEDPNESGGYFLAKGSEWVVDWLENISFNTLHVHKKMIANELVRGEFISQPGGAFENSSQVIIRYMEQKSLTVEINSVKFQRTRIPFYILFRLLGMTAARDIFEQIVYDVEGADAVSVQMRTMVEEAMKFEDPTYKEIQHELDREAIVHHMAARLAKYVTSAAYRTNEDAIQYLNTNLMTIMDRALLPHLGQDASSRRLKLRFLGMLIHKTLLVDMGILEPTDRDNYSNKRVHGAGVSIAKSFKTQFNNSVVMPLMTALKKMVRNNEFEKLTSQSISSAVKTQMNNSELGRTLEQAITSGNKTIKIRQKTVNNRVSTQSLERKNTANYYSALRTVSTHNASQAAKQTERADRMRRVHPSYTGYICVAKSADTGEMVGMKKELALTATICEADEPLPLIAALLADPEVVAAADVATPDIVRKKLACVFVNGTWVGCCAKAHRLVTRYRALRRASAVVPPQASIVWNSVTDDVDFLLDVGRLTRPLLIVDNNLEEFRAAQAAGREPPPFHQNIRLTPAHVAGLRAGTLSLEDLRREGVVEWITPQEATNCLAAPSIAELRRDRHDVTRAYTHCDVEQAIFGITALVSPFANHTQPARVTYETNQGRQAGGWYSFAAPFRLEKNRFFQHYCEAPLVRTVSYNWLYPNGVNTVVAYMINTGYNQEDSAVVKKGFIQRGGFAGGFYRYEKKELEKDCSFRTPDITTTKNLRPGASYEKLVDGFTPPGTVVREGDVLIGCVKKAAAEGRAQGSAADDGYQFIDSSEVYRLTEPAVVSAVYTPHGPHDNKFGAVKLRYHRPLGVGDKLSSRAGNKSIVALEIPENDLPFDENGVTPDIIINPHSIPSRMTIGQMIETSLGLVCQHEGCITDGTAFRTISIDDVHKEMADIGLRFNGLSRLYNGRTGEHYDAAIFMGPTYHQRLQKFVKDDEYAVGSYGSTDPLTGQPLDGKNARGGLRIGEMEAWVLQSHGAMSTLTEKMFNDSDGRKYNICRRCGGPAIHNAALGIYRCPTCKENADISYVDSCRASMVFQQEMRSANVKFTLGARPREYEEPLKAGGA